MILMQTLVYGRKSSTIQIKNKVARCGAGRLGQTTTCPRAAL